MKPTTWFSKLQRQRTSAAPTKDMAPGDGYLAETWSAPADERIAEPESLAGYVRMPKPPKAPPASPRPIRSHLLVVMVGPGPAAVCTPRVVGRMVLRGYIASRQPNLGGVAVAPLLEPSATLAGLPPGAHLRPVGRLSPLAEAEAAPPSLRAVQSGLAYRLTSPANQNLVIPTLAEALERAFERFAESSGFTAQNPVPITLTRGYEADDRGHYRGLAADIASVDGRGLREWKQDWDRVVARAGQLPNREARRAALVGEVRRNLGYQLYRTLLEQGGWRVFNNVVQLFGPWTDQLGPWRQVHFDQPTTAQRQFMAEQERIFQAHQDHIHVAQG